jgi:sterol desaturase/sphingolipid hydroxylase (fatty acid hydroxylase superfamily)
MTIGTLTPWFVLGGLYLVLFICERWMPLREAKAALPRRLFVNVCISALALIAALLIVKRAGALALQEVGSGSFGLLHFVELPPALQLAAGFALIDLSFYYWHVANHRIAFLWRFHNVHHIDRDLDVTTAFRFHFGEVAMSAGFRVVQIALTGVSPITFAIYEFVFQVNTLFHHSNVRLPIRLERWLNKIVVTPRMHGIHHSEVWRENNSNYSVVFSWWDRLHRTLRLNVPQSHIVVGIPGYAADEDGHLLRALLLPFVRQRDYWQRGGGATVEGDRTDVQAPLSYLEK